MMRQLSFTELATARALLFERSSLDGCNAVGEFFWYVRVAIVRKNENSGSKDLNKFTNLRSGA